MQVQSQKIEDRLFVINNQDRFGESAGGADGFGVVSWTSMTSATMGSSIVNRRPSQESTGNADPSSVFFHDAIRQTEPLAGAFFLGGEERVKYPVQIFGDDAPGPLSAIFGYEIFLAIVGGGDGQVPPARDTRSLPDTHSPKY